MASTCHAAASPDAAALNGTVGVVGVAVVVVLVVVAVWVVGVLVALGVVGVSVVVAVGVASTRGNAVSRQKMPKWRDKH